MHFDGMEPRSIMARESVQILRAQMRRASCELRTLEAVHFAFEDPQSNTILRSAKRSRTRVGFSSCTRMVSLERPSSVSVRNHGARLVRAY
jgi:hypothetical protein